MKNSTGVMSLIGCLLVLLAIAVVPTIAQDSSMSEEELLTEMNKELLKIEDSLKELKTTVDDLSPTTSFTTPTEITDSTTAESTSTSGDSTSISSEPTSTAESTSTSGDSTSTAESTSTSVDSTSTAESTSISSESASTAESTSTSGDSTSTSESTSISSESASTAESTSTSGDSTSTAESTSISSESTSTAESTSTSVDSTFTAESTSTSDSTSGRKKRSLQSNEAICNSDHSSEEDLCPRLIKVLDEISEITTDIDKGNITETHLRRLEESSIELNGITESVDEAFVNTLNLVVLDDKIEDLENQVTAAINTVNDKIPDAGANVLVIVLGTVGGLVVAVLLGVAIYTFRERSLLKKKENYRKLNETSIPIQSFIEEGNTNRGYVQEDQSLHRPNRGHGTGIIPKISNPSRRPYENTSRPISRRNSFEQMHKESRPYDTRSMSPEEVQTVHPTSPPKDYDPYSIEGRGGNVKRVTSGGLRRYDS